MKNDIGIIGARIRDVGFLPSLVPGPIGLHSEDVKKARVGANRRQPSVVFNTFRGFGEVHQRKVKKVLS